MPDIIAPRPRPEKPEPVEGGKTETTIGTKLRSSKRISKTLQQKRDAAKAREDEERKNMTKARQELMTASRIALLADPIGFLCEVVNGNKVKGYDPKIRRKGWVYPVFADQLAAAKILAAKVMPDLKSVEHSGTVGEPMKFTIQVGDVTLNERNAPELLEHEDGEVDLLNGD